MYICVLSRCPVDKVLSKKKKKATVAKRKAFLDTKLCEVHSLNQPKAVHIWSAHWECPLSCSELEPPFAQFYIITALWMRTSKDADPEVE